MANKIQVRRGNKVDLPVLSDGEPGLCVDTEELFFGSPSGNIGIATSEQLAAIRENNNALSPSYFRTYDFSDKVVHPDVIKVYQNFGVNGEEVPATYFGYTYWMAATPYPGSNNNYENPSLWASNDGTNWIVPVNITNPVVASLTAAGNVVPYTVSSDSPDFNSDPDWLIDPTDIKFKMIYRVVNGNATNKIMYIESGDGGVTWTTPFECYQDTVNHNLSPAIIKLGPNSFEMYYVETTIVTTLVYTIKKRTSTDMKTWSSPISLTIPTLPDGRRPWHIDALKTHTGIELLLNTNPSSEHRPDALFILSSTDGTTFSFENDGQPILTPSGSGWDDYYIYRGSFAKRSDGYYQIWYSARNTFGDYHVGYVEGFLTGGLRPVSQQNGIPANQRFYFSVDSLTPSWESTMYAVPGTALTILGAFNSVSGERRVEALLSDIFAGRDIGTLSASYQLGRLRLGDYYLWVDTTGDLRIKSGAPASDTDGTVVGTQS